MGKGIEKMVLPNGTKSWYLNDKKLTKEEFNAKILPEVIKQNRKNKFNSIKNINAIDELEI